MNAYEKPLSVCNVAIAGLGLMGGSLGLALSGKVARVIGVARRPESLVRAQAIGAIDAGCTTLREALPEVDILVLATPVSVVLQQIEETATLARAGHARPGLIVLDLGSTKQAIVQAMAALPASVEPVGGHPMCGKELSGLDVAHYGLYERAPFVITALARTHPQATALVESLVLALSARPIYLDADRHDRLVAAISHLPYTTSLAVFLSAAAAAERDPVAWQLAAGGFRSATRLASSEPTMWTDILLTNREAVLSEITELQTRLSEIAGLIAAGDERGLKELASSAREQRATFLERYGG